MKSKIFVVWCLMLIVSINVINIYGEESEYYQSNFVEDSKVYEINGDYYESLVHIRLFSDELDSKDRILKSKYKEILNDKVYLKIYKNIPGNSYTVSSQEESLIVSTEYLTSKFDLYIKNNKILSDNFKRAVGNKYVTKLLFLEEEIEKYIKDKNLSENSNGGPEFLELKKLCNSIYANIDRWAEPITESQKEEIYYWNEPTNYNEQKEVEEQVSNVVIRVKYLEFLKLIKEVVNEYEQIKLLVDYSKNIDENNELNNGINTELPSVEEICKDGWWGCAFQFLNNGKNSGVNPGIPGMLSELQSLVFDIGNIIFLVVTAFLGVKYIWGGADSKFSVKNSLVTLVVAAIVFYGWNSVTTIFNIQELLTGANSAGGYQNFVGTVYNTIMYIVNIAAIGGIIYIGIKYMMAGADGKAEMKLKMIPVIMGIIMVYGTLNLINFILDIVYTF